MIDSRIQKLARIMVDHSTRIKPGDKVAIESTTNAEELVRAIYELCPPAGRECIRLAEPARPGKDILNNASDQALDYTPPFQKLVTEQFDAYIRVRAETDARALRNVSPARQGRWQKAFAPIRNQMISRGGEGTLRWALTQYPTQAYAEEAGMSFDEYEKFAYMACHADEATPDPVAYWKSVEEKQRRIVERIEGHDKVKLMGPNVDLNLSIKGRKFRNSSGQHNMPDGEIYTGPVEESVNGWVKYTYPAIFQGRMVEGIELFFEKGRVVQATAEKDQEFLQQMINSDVGSHYVGEFAIGTNFEIDRFTHNILFDEKLGGTFHMALGAGYPETGSLNASVIHWDMICDLRNDSEIRVDGVVVYRDGQFTF